MMNFNARDFIIREIIPKSGPYAGKKLEILSLRFMVGTDQSVIAEAKKEGVRVFSEYEETINQEVDEISKSFPINEDNPLL